MPRATKIVATIGPASSDLDTLTRMIAAGVDVVRLNFSHGKAQDHIERASLVRQAAAKCGREVAIMADLQGPKIRIGKFENGKIFLENGGKFVLDAACDLGNQAKVGLDYGNSRIAVLRGDEVKDPNDPTPPYWEDVGRNKVIFSSVHLNSRTFPHYERKLREFQPDILTCYPSSLDLLTHLAEPRNASITFKLAITSSETLGAGLRARVKRVFGAPLLDYYGQTERSCAAYSLEDQVYRFIFPYAYPELIPGADGKCSIVGTPFWNRAQPLIRYDIGDIALLPEAAAESESEREKISLGFSTFNGIEGRRSDCLKLADGSRVFGLDRVPSGVDGAASVQIVQVAPEAVLMVVVPNAQYTEETLTALRRKFYLKVPHHVDLRIDLRESPYRLASGKAPVFISQVQEPAR